MIEIANQRFRNLQEQVAWLTLMINRATDIVKNIAGTAPDVASLAPASTYSNGTTFAIGAAAPYDYYVALNGNWVELGTMPLAGPAGSNGINGFNVFITSQATTASTTFINGTSIYNPDSRAYQAGDLIFSEQGDVFVVTASSAPGCTVVYRYNIMGPQGVQGPTGSTGARGNTWIEGDDIAYSSPTYSWGSSDWPVGFTPKVGDLYLISTDYTDGGHDFTEGDVFIVTNVVAYGASMGLLCTLKGSKGDTGSILYNGSDLTYDALGLQVEASLSDVPDIRVDDYYLVASDYTDSGHDFYEGDVFVCTSVGVSTADLSYVCSVKGPQGDQGPAGADGTNGTNGTNGTDGATIFNGVDVYHTGGGGGAYVIDVTNVPTMKANDYYLSTSTYTSDGETITEGDLWQALNLVLSDTAWLLTRVVNLKGASGSSVWGSITGTLADQTDLKSALDGKLSLSGGTMTGAIRLFYNSGDSTTPMLEMPTGFSSGVRTILKKGSTKIIEYNASSNLLILGYTSGSVQLKSSAADLNHYRGSTNYPILDSYNTKANESGGTTVLTELTLAGTKYKAPTAAGGFTFSVSGSQGAFDLYVMGYISGEYGLHHLTKSSGANIYRNGTSVGATSITIANASFIIPKSADTTGLDSATGDVYTAAGVSAAYIDWGSTYANQQLHLDSNFTIVYAS